VNRGLDAMEMEGTSPKKIATKRECGRKGKMDRNITGL
jgi:hypothetical protein